MITFGFVPSNSHPIAASLWTNTTHRKLDLSKLEMDQHRYPKTNTTASMLNISLFCKK